MDINDSKSFLGCGLKFPLQVDPKTGKLAMVSFEEDIKEAIGIIINTIRGERVMRPDFGTNTADYVFSSPGNGLRETISHDIARDLRLQEPRIQDITVSCGEVLPDGKMAINVGYTVRSTNNRYNFLYPFYILERSKLNP